MLRTGSFRHLRRFVACYCLPSSYFETIDTSTPTRAKLGHATARIFTPFHLCGGSSPDSDQPLVTPFTVFLQELAGDRVTDSYLHHEVFS